MTSNDSFAYDLITQEFKERSRKYKKYLKTDDFYQQCWCELIDIETMDTSVGLSTAITLAMNQARQVVRKNYREIPVPDVERSV